MHSNHSQSDDNGAIQSATVLAATIETPILAPAPENGKRDDTPRPQLSRLGDLLGAWEADALAAHEARVNGTPRGPQSGFASLDRELGGCFSPGLHIVHGQPGSGKTAFALQIAATCGCPALFLSCEMSPLELLRRHTARVTRTFLGRLKSGEYAPADSLKLAREACAAAPLLALADGTRAYAPPLWLRDAALAARGDHKHLLVVVDSLHSWAEGAPVEASEYETLGAALLSLRQLAHLLGCPVLAIAERNRDAMKGGGLSAGAGTRKIEYGAETVIDLTRDMGTREDLAGNVAIKLKLAKNRSGAAGRELDFQFHGAKQNFSEA